MVVLSEMLSQLSYAGRKYGNLQIGSACIGFVGAIFADYGLLFSLIQSPLLGFSRWFLFTFDLSILLGGDCNTIDIRLQLA